MSSIWSKNKPRNMKSNSYGNILSERIDGIHIASIFQLHSHNICLRTCVVSAFADICMRTHPLMMRLLSKRYALMCCTPMVSLKRSGTRRRSSPRRSGVWYRDTLICSGKRWSSGSNIVRELCLPLDSKTTKGEMRSNESVHTLN